ncbi:hypothetical protein I0C86_41325 [Plantactinospora sp. S1510]|uniref:DivIVA domain-containing protein n=1 Tax=Plantactinospora alkalitolerans TaxID=2789879 RepID=A0ABS0HA05_9ACTN|nr:hypothetical protein [Plantactinospora alkalitolerans]MBF9135295.1 hypothetical protein [Plantactinospora alkalitolerans]
MTRRRRLAGPTMRDVVRHYLGLDEIDHLLTELERRMATAAEQLDTLSTKVDDLVADVRAALDALEADRENLTPDGQAALDRLTAKVDAFDTEIGDADGSDTPPAPPAEPTF